MKTQVIHKEGGTIEFCEEDDGSYYIEGLNSEYPGGGKAVIKEFRKKVGENKKITADVIEPETRKRLLEMNLLDQCEQVGRLEITNHEILDQLKIIHVFRGGGANIDRLVLTYEPDATKEDIEVTFYDGKKVAINLFGET